LVINMACDRIAQVHAYHDDALSDARRAEVEAHLHSCDVCATLLTDLRRLSRMVDEAQLVEMPSDAMLRLQRGVRTAASTRAVYRITGWMTAAAAAVLVVVSVTGRVGNTGNGPTVASGASDWETIAISPRVESRAESGSEVAQAVQLMVTGFEPVDR
jgi:anti-sigma factor RsiW